MDLAGCLKSTVPIAITASLSERHRKPAQNSRQRRSDSAADGVARRESCVEPAAGVHVD